jgi:hypothetical protein
MSIHDLEKNFGGGCCSAPVPQEPVQVVAVQSPVEIYTPRTSFESVSLLTRCESCNGGHFWRWKAIWFCARCRVPPDAKFVEEEFGGTGVLTREEIQRRIEQERNQRARAEQKCIASECYWSRDYYCRTQGCRCRMVKETAFTDGTCSLNCYMCGAVAISDFDL